MSKYTTGEIAKLCGVTVRTVQYYDTRGILTPSELSEGGRRLYSEADLRRMKVICFLREAGLSINSIAQLLHEENPDQVIEVLLDQQEALLRQELSERQTRLGLIGEIRRGLKDVDCFTVESIGDIAYIMENKKKLKKLYIRMICVGTVMDLIEIGTAILWWKTGIWQPFAIGMPVVIALGVWISKVYYRSVDYICPACHEVFHPRFKEMFWARHTPRTRRLTCPKCGRKGMCVEVFAGMEAKIE